MLMATATKPPVKPVKPVKPRAAKKAPELGTLDYLQHALEDLAQARRHAQQDARGFIDSAAERIRAASKDLRSHLPD
jgi:hypothetical protein